MILTYKEFHKITFPAYLLPNDNWYSEDGLLFQDNRILDDKNMSGETLGIRRLQTYFKSLHPLRKAVDTPTALIKCGCSYFIDSLGKCFIYEKTLFCKVKYYSIKEIEYKENLCVLRVNGIKFAFTIPRPPKAEHVWVGILHLGDSPWLLYEYAGEKLKTKNRKV